MTAVSESDEKPGFRIVQAVQEFSTEGGVETVSFELANAWERAGFESVVLASVIIAGAIGTKAAGSLELVPVAAFLRWIPTRGAFRYLGRLLVVPLFSIFATFRLRNWRDALVVSHGDSFRGDVLVVHAVNAASLAEKKREGEWVWRLNPMHYWVGLRDRIMIGGGRYRRYVAVSARVATELQTYYGVPEERIAIIPNGIDVGKFKPDEHARQEIRRRYGIADETFLLLFAGHEFGRKGLGFAIEALGLLGDRDVCLLVVGSDDAEAYKSMAAACGKRVIFAGAQSQMPPFYAAADAFVLPTAYETFSLVCMEAMASGVPVFATRVGGIEDYLKDGENGYGIERDAADIAAKIEIALSDKAHFLSLGAKARATAQHYSWDGVAARYAHLFEDVWQEKSLRLSIKR